MQKLVLVPMESLLFGDRRQCQSLPAVFDDLFEFVVKLFQILEWRKRYCISDDGKSGNLGASENDPQVEQIVGGDPEVLEDLNRKENAVEVFNQPHTECSIKGRIIFKLTNVAKSLVVLDVIMRNV